MSDTSHIGALAYFRVLKARFPPRLTEWLCAAQIFMLGVGLVLSPGTFERTSLKPFAEYMPTHWWAWSAVAVGTFRLASLFVNGHAPRISGPMRVIGAAAGGGFFGLLLGRFIDISTVETVALGVYPFTMWLIADVFNGARAGADTLKTWRRRNDLVL